MEIEFKFLVPADRLKAVEKEMRAGDAARTHLQARYFDTADRLLAEHRVALRLRKEGQRWMQTAKAPGEGPLHRLEHNADRGEGSEVPALDLGLLDDTDVGAVLHKLLHARHGELQETFSTDIRRTSRHVRHGESVIELALDLGKVTAPADASGAPRESRVCELELELVEGSVADLVALAQDWSRRHGLWLGTLSKAQRGERLGAAQDDVRAVKASSPLWPGHEADGAEVQRAVIQSCLAHVLPNASEVVAGDDGEEVVHQLRVGIRRLRTALRELDGLDPGRFDPAWEAPLVEAFRALGARRDFERISRTLPPRLRGAGAPEFELPVDKARRVSCAEAARDPAFQQTLVALVGFAAVPRGPRGDDAATPAGALKHLRKHLRKLHREVVEDGKRFETLYPQDQHRVRKRLKRLRYLAEFIAPLFDDKAAADYIEDLVPAQGALGEFNDDAVAIEACRAAVKKDTRAWFAVGWLSALQIEQAAACKRALGSIDKARKFWKKNAR